jgi:hypothetical protein
MITLGPSLMGLRGTQVTGFITYTLVSGSSELYLSLVLHRLSAI